MSSDNVQDYLNKGMYGANQTNPEERRKYLGSLRERIYLSMTIEQVISKNYLSTLKKEITAHPNHTLLLNGTIDMENLEAYIQLCNQLNCPFRMVSDENAKETSIGLIYVAKEAVNIEVIDVSKKQKPAEETITEKKVPEKKSFFKRFFS
ncbi:YueI family protein [Carnobacterium sp.]|uniref:YueI family protein n=1 Tax=Carnobacterium sp. TaxID=48221 RepID=UPI0028B0CE14|nr:YueI family protein [Carnobacterium sp.]